MGNYCIYMHTNKVDKKVYIGRTSRKPSRRWNYGYGYQSHKYFNNAIAEFGWDNFSHEILETGLTAEQADYLEKKYIREYKADNPLYGYNIQSGGKKYTLNEVGREQNRGENNPFYGKKHTEEARLKMSKSHIDVSGEKNPNFGNEWSQKQKEHLRKLKKGKKVKQFSKDGVLVREWDYIRMAEKEYGIYHGDIAKCCRGKSKSAGGYKWQYAI